MELTFRCFCLQQYSAGLDRSAYIHTVYYDNAQSLPAEYYSLENTELVIPAGTVTSEAVMVKFKNLLSLDSEQVYVLPVTIAQAGIDVLQSARTMYYVLKGAALINVVGNITKNSIHVDWKRPEVANNLRQMTAEALIRVSKFDKMLTTIMGIEGQFLILRRCPRLVHQSHQN